MNSTLPDRDEQALSEKLNPYVSSAESYDLAVGLPGDDYAFSRTQAEYVRYGNGDCAQLPISAVDLKGG